MFNKMNPLASKQVLVFILIALSCISITMCNREMNTKNISKIPTLELDFVIDYGIKQMDMLSRLEYSLANANKTVQIGSSSFGQFIDSKPSTETLVESRYAEVVIKATTYIANKYFLIYGKDSVLFAKTLSNIQLNETSLGKMCVSYKFKASTCLVRNLKYRSSDGSCNNLKKPYWGKSNTAYRRNIYPSYKDGISEMNNLLPNPRELSNSLAEYKYHIDTDRTMAVGIWALFIGHDMSHTAVSSSGATNKSIECCDESGSPLSPRYMHPLCAPIKIADTDPYFRPLRRTCMNYVRSAPTLRTDCTFGPREQVNQATHYLDGSMIYGTSYRVMKSLRKNSGGLMLMDSLSPDNITVLPVSDDPTLCHTDDKCYRSGDSRVNSHPYLLALYTVWVKEHNRIAGKLALINPHWNDETLFQETRRIIIAMIQHITFNEWLPVLVSDSHSNPFLRQYFDLTGAVENYTDNVDATTTNVFANVIVPMAYSAFGMHIVLNHDDQRMNSTYESNKHYNKKPYEMLTLHFDNLLRGFTSQKTDQIDMSFSNHVTNQLHEDNGFGMDIVSLSIQRSRDHGIPSFTKFRRPCELTPIENEKDLVKIMDETIVSKLMRIYKNVDDIELIVGALLEKPVKGSMIGSTMMCIIRDQLVRIRMGDRYFYDLPKVFTQNQLAEIRNVTLARLLCSNSNAIKQVQLNVFKTVDANNDAEMFDCDSTLIPKLNLQHWVEIIDSNFK